jgi:hypothetical protein
VRTISSRPVYGNDWISVREDTVRRADGSAGVYGVVDSPDIALIVRSDVERTDPRGRSDRCEVLRGVRLDAPEPAVSSGGFRISYYKSSY